MARRGERTEWDDEAKAITYVQWIACDKRIRETSRVTGVPVATVGYWAKQWEKDGPPESMDVEIRKNAYEFVDHANRVRKQAMEKLEELLVGIMTENSNKGADFWKNVTIKDYYLSPQDALNLNVIDVILEPNNSLKRK